MCVLEHQPENAANFKASDGWFYLFCKRRKILFRKRKIGKKCCGEENLNKIIKVSFLMNPCANSINLTLFYLVLILF